MNRGLLRFHDSASAPAAQATIDAMFRPRGLAAEVFAFDWLARQFAVTSSLTIDGKQDHSGELRTVVLLDPFDGSITPWVDVQAFEQALSVPLAQNALLPDLFQQWMTAVGINQLDFDMCAGASVPGFYGGKREIGSLTLDSTDVYLAFVQQLWEYGQKNGPGSPPPHLQTAKGK